MTPSASLMGDGERPPAPLHGLDGGFQALHGLSDRSEEIATPWRGHLGSVGVVLSQVPNPLGQGSFVAPHLREFCSVPALHLFPQLGLTAGKREGVIGRRAQGSLKGLRHLLLHLLLGLAQLLGHLRQITRRLLRLCRGALLLPLLGHLGRLLHLAACLTQLMPGLLHAGSRILLPSLVQPFLKGLQLLLKVLRPGFEGGLLLGSLLGIPLGHGLREELLGFCQVFRFLPRGPEVLLDGRLSELVDGVFQALTQLLLVLRHLGQELLHLPGVHLAEPFLRLLCLLSPGFGVHLAQ